MTITISSRKNKVNRNNVLLLYDERIQTNRTAGKFTNISIDYTLSTDSCISL